MYGHWHGGYDPVAAVAAKQQAAFALDQRETDYHEAAHGVVAALGGCWTHWLSSRPDAHTGLKGCIKVCWDASTHEEAAVALMAGPIAAYRYLQCERVAGRQVPADMLADEGLRGTDRELVDLLLVLIADDPAGRERCRRTLELTALEVIGRPDVWGEIVRTADALAQAGGFLDWRGLLDRGLCQPKARTAANPSFAPVLCQNTREQLRAKGLTVPPAAALPGWQRPAKPGGMCRSKFANALAKFAAPAGRVRDAGPAGCRVSAAELRAVADDLGLPADHPAVEMAAMQRRFLRRTERAGR